VNSTAPTTPRPAGRAKTVFWILLGVVALGVVIGALVSRSPSTTAAPDEAGRLVRENSRVLSQAPDERAVLVEFLDYECEACAGAYPFIEDLRTEYADTLTVVHRYFPLPGHPNSMTAAIAVEAAAQQGAYEPMYQKLFETQTQWSHHQQDQSAVFRGYAEQLGLDMAAYDAAVADPATQARIELDVADGQALGVAGTPSFYLDGQPLAPSTLEEFAAAVDAATQD
jgi:protein-disulfide isomerase